MIFSEFKCVCLLISAVIWELLENSFHGSKLIDLKKTVSTISNKMTFNFYLIRKSIYRAFENCFDLLSQ